MTNFEAVIVMNEAFGNPQGNPGNIDWDKVGSQCKNILDEYKELMVALEQRDLDGVRDALCDIHVFAYGAHHLLGFNADVDHDTVVNAVMTRFVKDDQDLQDTLDLHAAKGVTETTMSGSYPTVVIKSAVDQPDAPKGKFLKSASYKQPVFYSQQLAMASYNGRKLVEHSKHHLQAGGHTV